MCHKQSSNTLPVWRFSNSDEVINNVTQRGCGQQGSYSRQVFLAVWIINVYVNTERGAPLQKCELSTSTIQAETETGGIRRRRQRKGIQTMGGKINAICLSHHAFHKYISAFLSSRQTETLLGHTDLLSPWCPLLQGLLP